jgi:Uma2 family endonuclease
MGMTFLVDPEFLPATLTSHPMTDEEFGEFCSDHPDLSFEMTAEGELIVMAPTYTMSGVRNLRVAVRLGVWAEADGRGIACDSSTGFVLPNGARRSPDASWTLKSRVEQMGAEERGKFWHLCPDFVIEIKSVTDRLRMVRAKMTEYMENGAQLGWLIDPEAKSVSVYRPGADVETITEIETVTGEGPVAGFVLDLGPVWNPLA